MLCTLMRACRYVYILTTLPLCFYHVHADSRNVYVRILINFSISIMLLRFQVTYDMLLHNSISSTAHQRLWSDALHPDMLKMSMRYKQESCSKAYPERIACVRVTLCLYSAHYYAKGRHRPTNTSTLNDATFEWLATYTTFSTKYRFYSPRI